MSATAELVQTKTCSLCHRELPADAFSPNHGKSKDGLQSQCRECRQARYHEGRPVASPGDRRCACGTKLSMYNRGPVCMPCEDKARLEAELKQALTGAIPKPKTKPRKEVMRVGELFTLKPCALPNDGHRSRPSMYREMVEEFLASGEECVAVEGPVKAGSMYSALASVKGKPGTPGGWYATVRSGVCYLVRVKK